MNKKIYLIVIGLILGLYLTYNYLIPFNKNHGTEFNSEREKFGLPKLDKDWLISDYESDQFITYWWKPEPRIGHFKKVIEYGILGVKYETDYYHNPKLKGTFAWSIYDYNKKMFFYVIEQPNKKMVEVTKKGELKHLKPTKKIKVTKVEFDNYKSK